ncbi:hypothetical protein QQF64_023198, partial [Cirrhinus molitorella]
MVRGRWRERIPAVRETHVHQTSTAKAKTPATARRRKMHRRMSPTLAAFMTKIKLKSASSLHRSTKSCHGNQ